MGHRIGLMVNNADTYGNQIHLIGIRYVLTVLIVQLLGHTKEPEKQMQMSLSAK